MSRLIVLILFLTAVFSAPAQNVTIKAVNQPAAVVFRNIVKQTGKNFVYSSDLLKDLKVNVDAHDKPLKKVLNDIFRGTGITYSIKGNNVVLKRRKKPENRPRHIPRPERRAPSVTENDSTRMLDELVVVSRLESPAVATPEIGARKITADEIRKTPVLLGESDVIKTLQTLPGVTEGAEGMASMHVHGGNADENLCMLDNVPLYQVNHFAGLFSAFNVDVIRYMDFFSSSVPAKYDGRLSSFMDIRTRNGNPEGHHGSARLGITSGAFDVSGPIGKKTTYLVAMRRSWYDILTIPALAIANSRDKDMNLKFGYSFMDINAKIRHHFSPRLNGFVSAYLGNDMLNVGNEDKMSAASCWYSRDRYRYNWGNLVAQAGMDYRISPTLTAEFTAAYTRFFSSLKCDEYNKIMMNEPETETRSVVRSNNNINDWILRADLDWKPGRASHVRFGVNYVRHSFLPERTSRSYVFNDTETVSRDSTRTYGADEFNAYIEDNWRISPHFMLNVGLHASLFSIDGKIRHGISPRLSVSYRPNESIAVKAAYTRTVQYVHQLGQSYLALPTDQWIPVTGSFRPQTADKVALGGYWQSADGGYAVSIEGYYKFMHNLLDYRDEYYLLPPMERWDARLTSGSGTARGIDFKLEKTSGRITGHISYSLAWSDRRFSEKNGGLRFPARFDNRHTINVVVNWNISDRVSVGASWVGHSGNRFTLLTQMFDSPGFGDKGEDDGAPLRAPVNNYQLPFYHRLDLACTVRNRRGYWNFSLYNAYCHMNTVAIRRTYKVTGGSSWNSEMVVRPVFQKVKLLPIIPSISYTWQF